MSRLQLNQIHTRDCSLNNRDQLENDEFVLPRKDVCLLPIVHSSAEELARLIWEELHAALAANQALGGVRSLEIAVAEGPGQAAIYEAPV